MRGIARSRGVTGDAIMKGSLLAEKVFRLIPCGSGNAVTIARVVAALEWRPTTPAAARRVLKRLAAAGLVIGVAEFGGRALLFHRTPGAVFSHTAFAAARKPPSPPKLATSTVEAIFGAIPVAPGAATVVEIVAALNGSRTRETAHRLLQKLRRAGVIERKVERGRCLFYRASAAPFCEATLNGAVPSVKTVVGAWHRDRHGNLTRKIEGVEVTDDGSSVAAHVPGRAGGLARAAALAHKSQDPASRNSRQLRVERYENREGVG
jgi:hypothetical protein